MKTEKELNTLKEEVETVNQEFSDLSGQQLEQVSGSGKGLCWGYQAICKNCGYILESSTSTSWIHKTYLCPKCKRRGYPILNWIFEDDLTKSNT